MECKWIKVIVDFFDDEKILLIEKMKNGDTIIVIWLKLLTLAGKLNSRGVFKVNNKIPYTVDLFASKFRRPEKQIKMAFEVFEQLGMIEIINETVTLPNWGKHQSFDQLESKKQYMRNYMSEYREKQKQLINKNEKTNSKANCKTNCKTNCKANVSEAEEERDKERDKDKEREGEKEKCKTLTLGKFNNIFLTSEELEKLKNTYPDRYQSKIERLSSYLATSGKTYNNHYAKLIEWLEADTESDAKKNITSKRKASYDIEELEKQYEII